MEGAKPPASILAVNTVWAVSLKRLGPADLEVVLKWGVAFG